MNKLLLLKNIVFTDSIDRLLRNNVTRGSLKVIYLLFESSLLLT